MSLDSLYWVITHNCNDHCDHCYNSSQPNAVELTVEEAEQVIAHFPDAADAPARVVISGGEPLVNRSLLYFCFDALYDRYGSRSQYMLQTNGDLLTEKILDEILSHHVTRIDIASIDRYHKAKGERADILKALLESHAMLFDNEGALISIGHLTKPALTYSMWGSNQDSWIGGNWARGRSIETDTYLHDPSHNFCAITSGAKGFAGLEGSMQEVAVQLYNLYPCCPGTRMPLADLRRDNLTDAIIKVMEHPMWQALNRGEPWEMGIYKGVTVAHAKERTQSLGNICLWCDEFFERYYENFTPNTSAPNLNLHHFPSEKLLHIDIPQIHAQQ